MPPISQNPEFGEFSGTPSVRFDNDPDHPNRSVTLLDNFYFQDAVTGMRWDAPAGSVINGASIPRPLWAIAGSPFTGDYFYASIVHDVACDERTRPSNQVHEMFLHACIAGGVRRGQAKILYLAVSKFGPRWSLDRGPLIDRGPVATEAQQEEYLRRAQQYLDQHGEDAPIRDIDQYAQQP